MDRKKLLSLIKRDEGIKLDYKQKIDINSEYGKKELAKDICAIANSRGGRGYLIVGIEDKSKEITGYEKQYSFTEEQIQQIISTRCEPPIPIKVDDIYIDGKEVSVITIYDGQQKPYQIRENGAFYIRRGSTTDVMRKQELLSAFQENLNLILESYPVIRSSQEILDNDTIEKYFKNKGIILNSDNREFLLESSSIIYKDRDSGKYCCTFGGLLVFSNFNNLYIPHNMVRIKLNNKNNIAIVQGKLLDIIDKCEKVLSEELPNNYPKESVIEALKNAVLYRDYTHTNRDIEIIISRKSISVISPGNLIYSKESSQIPNDLSRNSWLYEKLITLDDKKRFLQTRRGFYLMRNSFIGKGKVKIINSKAEGTFKVIFPGTSVFE